jgi:L-histidine N-alpha-methyltransferase
VSFDAGEQMRTEISPSFVWIGFDDELAVAGLITVHSWTEPVGDFALTLAGLGR